MGEEDADEDCTMDDRGSCWPAVEMRLGKEALSVVVFTAITVGACCNIVASELGIMGTS